MPSVTSYTRLIGHIVQIRNSFSWFSLAYKGTNSFLALGVSSVFSFFVFEMAIPFKLLKFEYYAFLIKRKKVRYWIPQVLTDWHARGEPPKAMHFVSFLVIFHIEINLINGLTIITVYRCLSQFDPHFKAKYSYFLRFT